MDSYVDYIFGPGDGSTTTWTSRAELDLSGDGVADAVRLDFDGDGRRDDAMWDTDGDGVADLAAIDIGLPDTDSPDTGSHERYYSDSGKGVWDVRETDPSAARDRSHADTKPENTKPQDAGSADTKPGSVRTDIELRATRGGGGRLYLDSDSDGVFDQVLIDSDGDGRADTVRHRGEQGFDR